jgi:hypothetical protein
MAMHSGAVREAAALQALARNRWFDGTVEGLRLRIRLGLKAREVREGKQAAATA